MRKHWTLLIVGLVLVLGTFAATLVSGNTPTLGLDLQGGVSVVKSPVGNFTENSLDVAIDLIRERVDSLGTLEPEITRQGDDIVIDLPGVDNRQRAIELVGKTAELRFRPVIAVLPPEDAPTTTTTTGPPSTTGPAGETATSTTTTTLPVDDAAADEAAKAAIASCDQTAVATLTEIPTTRLADDKRAQCVVLEGRDGDVRYLLGPLRSPGTA